MPKFAPVTMAALLLTLVLIFAFQEENITSRFFHVVLIAVPITLQVYLNAGLAYWLMKLFKVGHSVARRALDRRFQLFRACGCDSNRALRSRIGSSSGNGRRCTVEVRVMLTVCTACNRTRHWFPIPAEAVHDAKEKSSHSLHRQFCP